MVADRSDQPAFATRGERISDSRSISQSISRGSRGTVSRAYDSRAQRSIGDESGSYISRGASDSRAYSRGSDSRAYSRGSDSRANDSGLQQSLDDESGSYSSRSRSGSGTYSSRSRSGSGSRSRSFSNETGSPLDIRESEHRTEDLVHDVDKEEVVESSELSQQAETTNLRDGSHQMPEPSPNTPNDDSTELNTRKVNIAAQGVPLGDDSPVSVQPTGRRLSKTGTFVMDKVIKEQLIDSNKNRFKSSKKHKGDKDSVRQKKHSHHHRHRFHLHTHHKSNQGVLTEFQREYKSRNRNLHGMIISTEQEYESNRAERQERDSRNEHTTTQSLEDNDHLRHHFTPTTIILVSSRGPMKSSSKRRF